MRPAIRLVADEHGISSFADVACRAARWQLSRPHVLEYIGAVPEQLDVQTSDSDIGMLKKTIKCISQTTDLAALGIISERMARCSDDDELRRLLLEVE